MAISYAHPDACMQLKKLATCVHISYLKLSFLFAENKEDTDIFMLSMESQLCIARLLEDDNPLIFEILDYLFIVQIIAQ